MTTDRAQKQDEAEQASGYLGRLLQSLHPEIELLDTLLGRCTQIDNVIVGLRLGRRLPAIKPIRTEKDYEVALARIDALMDAEPGTPGFDDLDILVDLVQFYESKESWEKDDD